MMMKKVEALAKVSLTPCYFKSWAQAVSASISDAAPLKQEKSIRLLVFCRVSASISDVAPLKCGSNRSEALQGKGRLNFFKKDLKAFLSKMMIICECFGASLPLLHFHRATIRETVLFI